MLSSLLYALRHASRRLIRDRAFAAVAVISIALGIGANAAIFSLVDQVLVRLLAVKEPERLVTVSWNGNAVADGWGSGNITSYPLCQDLREHKEVFDGVFCRHPTDVNLSLSSALGLIGFGRDDDAARAPPPRPRVTAGM